MNPLVQEKTFYKLLSKSDNHRCADCNTKSPTWASIDFGVFICLNCSGAHRALGPSVTRVRSTKLDSWNIQWTELLVLGNDKCNHYWEHSLGSFRKPNSSSSLEEIKRFVVEKYIVRRFAPPGQSDPISQLKLQRAKIQEFENTPLNEIFKAPKQQKINFKQSAFEKMSITTKPDSNLHWYSDLENLNTAKVNPIMGLNSDSMKKQPPKKQINLLSFQQSPKKNQSLNFSTVSTTQQFYADIYSNPNQNSYNRNQKNPYQQVPNNYNLFNTNNFLQFDTNSRFTYNQNYFPQNPFNKIGQSPPQMFIKRNNNQQIKLNDRNQQPITMNINMNMYANNVNINIPYQARKNKDLLNSFDQFRF